MVVKTSFYYIPRSDDDDEMTDVQYRQQYGCSRFIHIQTTYVDYTFLIVTN